MNDKTAAFPTSSIEDATWSSMESAGCVFLPAAGYRSRNDGCVYDRGGCGYYWSSSVNGDFARYLGITDGDAKMKDYRRAYGCSVRCVQE